MGPQDSVKWHRRMLRAWQLALLRFAVTLDNVDRLSVMAIAHEMDRGGRAHEVRTEFSFFRKTSADLCTSILRQNDRADALLRQYLARTEDVRLRRAFASAVEIDQAHARKRKNDSNDSDGLWRGLRPAAMFSPQRVDRSVDDRARAWRAIWGRGHACNDLPGGISSASRTSPERGRPIVRCRLCSGRTFSATLLACRRPSAHGSGSCFGLAQRACDPYLVRLIQANAAELEFAPHSAHFGIGHRLDQTTQVAGETA
jgi:hypothetical protein